MSTLLAGLAKVAAIIAVGSFSVYLLQTAGIEPFSSRSPSSSTAVGIVVGIVLLITIIVVETMFFILSRLRK